MFADQSFVNQFQAEINLIFAHTDTDGALVDLLTPIKNILNQQTTLVAYSLTRKTGASSDIAFFCEWFYQVFALTSDLRLLSKSNQQYWLEKLTDSYPHLPDLHKRIYEDTQRAIIPQQLAVLHQKTAELLGDLATKHEHLKKYLNHRYLNQFLVNSMRANQKLGEKSLALDSYLEVCSRRNAFLQLCFPCLLGFLDDFNNPESPINPSGIKWDVLENILYSIACLEQIGEGDELLTFLYGEHLEDSEKIKWQIDEEQSKYIVASGDEQTKEMAEQVIQSLYVNAKLQLRTLIFPENQKHLIEQILEYSVRFTKEAELATIESDQTLTKEIV
jgi:hypothetical protein